MNEATITPNTLAKTLEWFKTAKPNPTPHDLQVQVGVHLEEVQEFLTELELVEDDFQGRNLLGQALLIMDALATHLKEAKETVLNLEVSTELLDSLCDQNVTGAGVAYMLGCDFVGAMNEVNRSNFSKFDENGQPVLKSNGKIGKHYNYTAPDLIPFLVIERPIRVATTPEGDDVVDVLEVVNGGVDAAVAVEADGDTTVAGDVEEEQELGSGDEPEVQSVSEEVDEDGEDSNV